MALAPPLPSILEMRSVIERLLTEDVGPGDLTTRLTVPNEVRARGEIAGRSEGVMAGLPVISEVFRAIDASLTVEPRVGEGERISAGQTLGTVCGSAAAILTGERVALNLLQRMCGIATMTRRFVDMVAGTHATIVDTRKTAPGLRLFDKYAVRCGGGRNHRFGLFDGILIKDNHIQAAGGVGAALDAVRERPHPLRIEIEIDGLHQIPEALAGGAELILLDNMPPEELTRAVEAIGGRALTEASGGITLASVRAVAETGVDYISVGALTHSVPALDIGLELEVLP